MDRLVVDDIEIDGRAGQSVRIEGGVIRDVGPLGTVAEIDEPIETIDGNGGALIPGLHDHHTHLFALAARLGSLWCGPPEVTRAAELLERLGEAGGEGWIRAVGWDDTVAGWPDRDLLDTAVADRPVRLQHRSGAMWVLNSAALALLDLGDASEIPAGVETDHRGRPTGRISGLDSWMRERIGGSVPDLAAVSAALAARGVTGVTDATAHNGAEELASLAAARARGELVQRVTAMTASPDTAAVGDVELGPVKIVLFDPALPSMAALVSAIVAAHAAGRAVAIHAASRVTVVLSVMALAEAGATAGDRIEHASVVAPELLEPIAVLGVSVVTQPHFVAESGDRYLETVEAADLPFLYRCRTLLDAGIALAAGSDAPVGRWDPWLNIEAAVERLTASGKVVGDQERLSPEQALALYTTSPWAPGGPPRPVEPGAPADLCLLDRPWSAARANLAAVGVRATMVEGRLVHHDPASSSTSPHSSAVRASSRSPDNAR